MVHFFFQGAKRAWLGSLSAIRPWPSRWLDMIVYISNGFLFHKQTHPSTIASPSGFGMQKDGIHCVTSYFATHRASSTTSAFSLLQIQTLEMLAGKSTGNKPGTGIFISMTVFFFYMRGNLRESPATTGFFAKLRRNLNLHQEKWCKWGNFSWIYLNQSSVVWGLHYHYFCYVTIFTYEKQIILSFPLPSPPTCPQSTLGNGLSGRVYSLCKPDIKAGASGSLPEYLPGPGDTWTLEFVVPY